MALTAVEVRSLKLRDRAYKVSDSDGLQVHVQPTGQRYWRYAFRWAGRQQTMALGVFPAVSLSEARAKRDAAKKLLASGSNPATVAREEKRAALLAEQVTFKVVAEQWVAKRARAVRSQPDCRCGSRTTGGQGRPFNFAGTVVPVGIFPAGNASRVRGCHR